MDDDKAMNACLWILGVCSVIVMLMGALALVGLLMGWK